PADSFSLFERGSQDASQPSVGIKSRWLTQKLNAVCPAEFRRIEIKVGPACFYTFVQYFHLSSSDPCNDIGHTVIITNLRMLIIGSRIPRLGSEKYRFFLFFSCLGYERTSTGGGYNFVSVKR